MATNLDNLGPAQWQTIQFSWYTMEYSVLIHTELEATGGELAGATTATPCK
jgi:hypothetical protein